MIEDKSQPEDGEIQCPDCKGKGCESCNGNGTLDEGEIDDWTERAADRAYTERYQ